MHNLLIIQRHNFNGLEFVLKFILAKVWNRNLIWTNPSHSEPIRKKFCISFGEKWSKINPTQSEASIRMNLNHSDLGFIRIDSLDWVKLIFDRFFHQSRYKTFFGLVRIRSDSFGSMPPIESDQVDLIFDRFRSNKIQNVFRIDSESFGMVRKQIPEWLIRSERISIWYFLQDWYLVQANRLKINPTSDSFRL